jgi:thiol-disulfide isomerase/thioredoxin
MEGCGPCNATRPEWYKLKNVLSKSFLNKNDIVIVAIDFELCNKLKNIGSEPNSFPTIRYMTNKGEIIENYEDVDISKKDRTIDSFVEWIKHKTGKKDITGNSSSDITRRHRRHRNHRNHRNKQTGGKWSLKYKRSINCKSPKGFSQKQYCKSKKTLKKK